MQGLALAEVREDPVDRERDSARRPERDPQHAEGAPEACRPPTPGAAEAHVVRRSAPRARPIANAPSRTATGIAKPACRSSYEPE